VAQDAAKRAQPVSDAEVAQFYEQNKDRAQGRTLDQLRGQITDFLESQRKLQARAQLVEELKTKGGNDVKVLLDPPRYTVAVEDHDPIRGEATAPVTLVEFSDYQ
jgi:protein-disulfide isomerase